MPLIKPTTSAPIAPKPAASVGVRKPPQIPPITTAINPIIERLLISSERRCAGVTAAKSAGVHCGAMSGYIFAPITQYAIKRLDNSRPGTNPAMNNAPMEISVKTAQMIIRIDGGMSMPKQALPATTPRAKLFLYPSATISG